MYGIRFDDIHSYDDLGLFLTSKEVGTPEPKTILVETNGADGVIDLTKALTGHVQYKNRMLRFDFQVVAGKMEWAKVYNKVLCAVHGKTMRVVLDEDTEWYYVGRVTVNSWTSRKSINTIVVEVDAEPFKYAEKASTDPWEWDTFSFVDGVIFQTEYEVSGSLTVRVPNTQMIVCPVFECSADMTVTFQGSTYNLPAGSSEVFEIMLEEGINELTFTGTGSVKVIYKRGTF